MSLRAIKKRDIQLNAGSSIRPTLFKSSVSNLPRRFTTTTSNKTTTKRQLRSAGSDQLDTQHNFLGLNSRSNPELTLKRSETEFKQAHTHRHLLRSKSEGDFSAIKAGSKATTPLLLTNAKSEVHLESISAHSYEQTILKSIIANSKKKSEINITDNMRPGARSHRDLPESQAYNIEHSPRRMSECSLSFSQSSVGGGALSQRSGSSGSQPTLAYNSNPNPVFRVPIIGYEVMEERARFTVYKLRVEHPVSNDCWLVLRRYTDFVRLNSKLKQAYPEVMLSLPRKKLFGDNFNSVFLDNRVQGLQNFVNAVMAKEVLRSCRFVRDFFCLDEPPTYSESMEECRAIFEAQDETICLLKMQIKDKNELILSLREQLREEPREKKENNDGLKDCPLNGADLADVAPDTDKALP